MNEIVSQRDHCAPYSTARDHTIPCLQLAQHLLPLLLATLLWEDQEKIEDSEDENQGENADGPAAAAALSLERKSENSRTEHCRNKRCTVQSSTSRAN